MVDRPKEQLLGYLLDALEESEQAAIESELKQNPKLLDDLAVVRESLLPLWVAQPDFTPPPGLAGRTSEFVFTHPEAARAGPPVPMAPFAPDPAIAPEPAGNRGNQASWLDVAVAASVVVAATLLIFPAIQASRFNSRLAECGNNLRQLSLALTQYGDTHEDYFPPIYAKGKLAGAGIVGPMLVTEGYVDGSEWFVCPASPLAEEGEFRVPTIDDLLSASPQELASLRGRMAGSYGNNMGYVENGRYRSPRNLRRPFAAVMSDVPGLLSSGYQSPNHDGRGQNVLFECGRVSFYRTPRPHVHADNLFLNDAGMVDAGSHRNDSVIGPSWAVPRRSGGTPFVRTRL